MSWLGIIVLLVLVSILQTSLGGPWLGGHVSIDLTAVVVVYAALLHGPRHGAVAGFVGGLLADLAAPSTLGRSALSFTLIGYGTGLVGERTVRENLFTQAAILACAVFVKEIVQVAVTGPEGFLRALNAIVLYGLPVSLVTAVAGVALFSVYSRLTGQRVR